MAKKDVSTKTGKDKAPSVFGGDVDRMFDEFTRGMMVSPFYRRAMNWDPFRRMEKATGMITPDVDVTESDGEIVISAELPGMEEKDIDVEMSGNRLTIRGEKHEEHEEKEKDYHVSERRYGSFKRTMTVPDGIDAEKVDAKVKNGVLTVTLPKKAEAKNKTRKVSIKAG